ncbi:hypothetical protein QCE63_06885 [Caballeronia sp. LZ065]|uniref:hypothetical protein n=1 Tax=Caballeronia sp. LZ065 TaxID=3038571 RepID=UPI0028585481|nr:hypothetical protein [Caballeronia sp. LZ065]MDR5779153.1 hypothetical protein [Caballeronia sp. LZ065]
MKNIAHPLENNVVARDYYDRLAARKSKGAVVVWREAVETLTGSLPTWAARQRAARVKTGAARGIQQ